jgi:hypothetical protein
MLYMPSREMAELCTVSEYDCDLQKIYVKSDFYIE